MQSKNKSLISDQVLASKKRRQQIRNWCILIFVVVAIIAIAVVAVFAKKRYQ